MPSRHFTSSFDKSGLASSKSVTMPATTADACDAPLVTHNPSSLISVGSFSGRLAVFGRRPFNRTPGATMLGLMWPDAVGPLPEKGATSMAWSALLMPAAPTLMSHGLLPGAVTEDSSGPVLPAETTTTSPLSPMAQGRGLINLSAALISTATDCAERLEGFSPNSPIEGAYAREPR